LEKSGRTGQPVSEVLRTSPSPDRAMRDRFARVRISVLTDGRRLIPAIKAACGLFVIRKHPEPLSYFKGMRCEQRRLISELLFDEQRFMMLFVAFETFSSSPA
jgi:hypothetical protein